MLAPAPRPPLVRAQVLWWALGLAVLCFVFFKFCLVPVTILGDSMLPTYRDRTVHFLNRLAYWSEPPARGDVVGLRHSSGDIYIKRVIGLPGEELTFEEGRVRVNGRLIEEPYIEGRLPWDLPAVRLGTNEWFVMGDHRRVSVLGKVTRDRILGRIVSLPRHRN